MAKTKGQKKAIIDNLSEKIKDSKSMVFVSFDKLTVVENEALRNELKNENSEYITSKKTLLNVSLKNNEHEPLDFTNTKGQVAAILGYEDEVAPAKIVSKFVKTSPS